MEFVKPDKKRIVIFIALATFVYIAWTQSTPTPGIGLFDILLIMLLAPVIILHESIVGTLPFCLAISFYLYIISCILTHFYESHKRILIVIILLLFMLLGLWMMGIF